MPIIVDNTLNQIRSIAMGGDGRAEKAKRLAELIRKLGDYRWVGVYDVGAETVDDHRLERRRGSRTSLVSR